MKQKIWNTVVTCSQHWMNRSELFNILYQSISLTLRRYRILHQLQVFKSLVWLTFKQSLFYLKKKKQEKTIGFLLILTIYATFYPCKQDSRSDMLIFIKSNSLALFCWSLGEIRKILFIGKFTLLITKLFI